MTLDLSGTLAQLEALAGRLRGAQDDRAARLRQALDALRQADGSALNARAEASQGRTFFLPAEPVEPPAARYLPPEPPRDYCALSVDGSHIDVDRHLPVRCFLINLGFSVLTYGADPVASLFSRGRLYATEEELHLVDPASQVNVQPLEGALLGLKRTVEEVKALAEAAEGIPGDIPVLALVDGSLILWELAGEGRRPGSYPPFVREQLLGRGFLPALERLRQIATRRPLALAAYVSLPGSTEVSSALRLALCPYSPADCQRHCREKRPGQRPCDAVHGFTDRDLFAPVLAPGERSALFATRSSVVRDHYSPHRIHYFYVNVGEELARVELPEWVAQDERLLALAHSLVLDQCRRGKGYPVAIQEAHEQAVVSAADREAFRQMVELALTGQRLPVYTSEKQRSKRQRWV